MSEAVKDEAVVSLRLACADPDGPLYGSDIVAWIGDLIDACDELEAENAKLSVVYVVEDDHAIKYAGPSFDAAKAVLRGFNVMSVWSKGEWLGEMKHSGEWAFRTGNQKGLLAEIEVTE